jgi:hypothetical protein
MDIEEKNKTVNDEPKIKKPRKKMEKDKGKEVETPVITNDQKDPIVPSSSSIVIQKVKDQLSSLEHQGQDQDPNSVLTHEIRSLKDELIEIKRSIAKQNGSFEIIQQLLTKMDLNSLVSEVRRETDTVNISDQPVEAPRESSSLPKDIVKLLQVDEYSTKIYGKTYNYNHLIKRVSGYSWVPKDKVWLVPNDKVQELIGHFDENNVIYEHKKFDILQVSSASVSGTVSETVETSIDVSGSIFR